MANSYLLLLNSTLKDHLLTLDGREKKRLREKLEFLENGLWDTGVRVKKLRGVSDKVVFEARLSRAERIIFTLGRQGNRTAVYVWGIAGHDDVSAAARNVLPANAPFLNFEPAEEQELPEVLIDELGVNLYTQGNLEERTPQDHGPQKWLVLTDRQWERLLRASPGDSLELYLNLTAEQGRVLDMDPPLLLSGTAGSGKTTLAVYYLLRKELLDRRRAFITCSPHLKRFSERIYDGLTRHAALEWGTRPDFWVFRDLLFDLLRSAGKSVDPGGEVGLAEFTRIFSALPQARGYDPELVWEEIRAIIKGAKPPVSLSRYRRLLRGWEGGGLSELELAELKDFLLWLKNFELIEKIERFVEKRGHAQSYEAFVTGLGRSPSDGAREGGGPPGGGNARAVLREILRVAEKKASGFSTPLLSLREYQMLGRKRAPNFLYDREEIYAVARYYQERLESEGRFDEIDLTRRALGALQEAGEGRFGYELVACDEVQDLSDVQLSLVFRLARSCRGLLLAGDTRQIINPSGFRWEEVKTKFYERGVEVPEVVHLNLNFRCVGNVVRLANALLDLKQRLVGVSGSEFREEWKFSGKPPVLIQGIAEKEVLDRARITGAGQVFLARSAAEADRLKKVLDTELVFTLHEAKGLEFDTVFLWKFARDPKAAAVWRRIKTGHPFDSAHHPHIRHEINLLYVAVTRARNTLVMYDGPRPADVWDVDELESMLFRTDSAEELDTAWRRVSTPAEWEEQGDYFFERERWRAAAECYKNAGNAAGEEKARGFVLEQEGNHAAAGRLFEKHDYPVRAATSYERAGEPERALPLWERLGEPERARRCRASVHEARGEYEAAAAELEKLGDLEGALRCWERAGNHQQVARRHLAAKRYQEAALSFEKAGAVEEACRCYKKLKKPARAAELCFRSGRYAEAAALYKKLKNTDMLARCWEKLGDYYQLALLHQKAKRIDEATACFAKFAAGSEENNKQLLAEAERLEGGRTALKVALRFSALGRYERSAPVFFQKGYFEAALRDYERAGDHAGVSACCAALGEYYREAEEIEKSSHPDREELARRALHKHLSMAWLSKRHPFHALFAEAERLMQRGEHARALTRFKALRDAGGVYRAYLRLDRDDEALSYLVSNGLVEKADDYVQEKPELSVTPRGLLAVFKNLYREHRRIDLGSLDLLVDLVVTLASRCLQTHPGARTNELAQFIVNYLSHYYYFDFNRAFPGAFLNLAMELGNYNALFKLLYWELLEIGRGRAPEEMPAEAAAFLSSVRAAAERDGDRNLLALYAYFYDRQRFEQVLEELDIGGLEVERINADRLLAGGDEGAVGAEEVTLGAGEQGRTAEEGSPGAGGGPVNYKLFAGSARHYHRAVGYLFEAGETKEAAGVCFRHRDPLGAARVYERAGDLKSAGRYYRDGEDFQRALACYEKLDDRIGMARVYERMGDYAKAVDAWERLGRDRDVRRVRKKLAKVQAKKDQGNLF